LRKILQADPTEGIKTPKPAKTEGFVTWSDADVRHYYNRWPLGTRERIMIDVYPFTAFGAVTQRRLALPTRQSTCRNGLDRTENREGHHSDHHEAARKGRRDR
jgi:hypothetical protein